MLLNLGGGTSLLKSVVLSGNMKTVGSLDSFSSKFKV